MSVYNIAYLKSGYILLMQIYFGIDRFYALTIISIGAFQTGDAVKIEYWNKNGMQGTVYNNWISEFQLIGLQTRKTCKYDPVETDFFYFYIMKREKSEGSTIAHNQ